MNAVVIYKKSSWELYQESSDPALVNYLATSGRNVDSLKAGHDRQKASLDKVVQHLERSGIEFRLFYRCDLIPLRDLDFVFVVGGDGTFLEVSRYVRDIPMLGINSDPLASTGFFATSTAETFPADLRNIQTLPRTKVSRMEIAVNNISFDHVVLNDILFAHSNPAATTRYRLQVDGGEETEHKTSGLLACTAAGSTSWMYQEGGSVQPLNDDRIQYLHRGSRTAAHQFGHRIEIESLTRNGALFIDGAHLPLEASLGSQIHITPGKHLTILGDLETKRSSYT